jgi:glycerophosphoryl diester phosphodiesterase
VARGPRRPPGEARPRADEPQRRPVRLADLVFPADGVVAHRGGPHVFGPENTLAAYDGSLAAGITMIEAGDVQALADGSLVCMHDATVDRTTTGTGSVASFTSAGWRSLEADPATYQAAQWPASPLPSWTEVLDRIGGRCVVVPECKDGRDATAAAMCAELRARGLAGSAVVQSFTYSNCQVVAASGIAAMYLVSTLAAVPSVATLAADRVWAVGIDHRVPGDLTGLAADLHAAGIRLFAYTVDHQTDWASILAHGFDGGFTDDPLYAPAALGDYRRTALTHTLSGVHGHGYVRSGDGPYSILTRGDITGSPGAWRWSQLPRLGMGLGDLNPLATTRAVTDAVVTSGSATITSRSAAFTATDVGCLVSTDGGPGARVVAVAPDGRSATLSTTSATTAVGVDATIGACTLTFVHVLEALPVTRSTGFGVHVCAPDDLAVRSGAGPDIASSYLVRQRVDGLLQTWYVDADGDAVDRGSVACRPLHGPLTLTAGLAEGTTVAALPVSATGQPLAAGHQFVLPGSATPATVSAATPAGATSVPVHELRPTVGVAPGTSLPQAVTTQVVITPTNLVVSRPDEPVAGAVTLTDSSYRGGYLFALHTLDGAGEVSLLSAATS